MCLIQFQQILNQGPGLNLKEFGKYFLPMKFYPQLRCENIVLEQHYSNLEKMPPLSRQNHFFFKTTSKIVVSSFTIDKPSLFPIVHFWPACAALRHRVGGQFCFAKRPKQNATVIYSPCRRKPGNGEHGSCNSSRAVQIFYSAQPTTQPGTLFFAAPGDRPACLHGHIDGGSLNLSLHGGHCRYPAGLHRIDSWNVR